MITKTKFKPFALLACALLVLLALFCVGNYEVNAEAMLAGGYCGADGDNVQWLLDLDTGVMNVTGEGAMADYEYNVSLCRGYENYVKKIVIGEGITYIGENAFNNCRHAISVEFSSTVEEIAERAFHRCGFLNVKIGDSVTRIGFSAFASCSSLKTVVLGESLEYIESEAFKDCQSLVSVTVSKNIKEISFNAFSLCDNMQAVYIEDLVSWMRIKFLNRSANPTCCANYLYLNGVLLTELIIPEEITVIESMTFDNCSAIESIKFHDGVTEIKSGAFWGCENLRELTIPGNITIIGGEAFNNCRKLRKVNIEDGVKLIGSASFGNCDRLQSVKIPDSVESLGSVAFGGCNAMTEAVIGEGIKSIPDGVFTCCESLITVKCSENVTSINEYAFYGCSSLTNFVHGEQITEIGDYAFYGCSSLTDFVHGEQITKIGDYAFYGCSSLTDFVNSEQLTEIGDYAFSECSSIKRFELPYSLQIIGDYAFSNCIGMTDIIIPRDLSSLGKYVLSGCLSVENAELPLNKAIGEFFGVTEYPGSYPAEGGGNTYYIPKTLKHVTITGEYVQSYALANCNTVLTVTVKYGVISIGREVFLNCVGLKSIVLPDSVTQIWWSIFSGCSSLESVTVPFVGESINTANIEPFYSFGNLFGKESYEGSVAITPSYYNWVDSYGEYTYYIPASLKSVTVTGGIIPYGAFCDFCGLTSVTLGDNVTGIKGYAFYGCTGLKEVDICNGVGVIEDGAFAKCTGLTSIVIPETVTTICSSAFNNCSSLSSITVPDSVNYIQHLAFFNTAYYNDESNWKNGVLFIGNHLIKSTKDISGEYQIAYGTVSIASEAFEGCYQLTSIIIPESIRSISERAFWNCNGLVNVHFEFICGWRVYFDYTNTRGTYYTASQMDDPQKAAEILVSPNSGYLYCTFAHKFSDEVFAPTCTEDGYTFHTCDCGKAYYDEVVSAMGHNMKLRTELCVPESCTENGLKVYTCSRGCGEINNVEILAAHRYVTSEGNSEWVIVTEPTCYQTGYRYRVCKRGGCGERNDVVGDDAEKALCIIPATGNHVWNNDENIVESTTTKPGYYYHTCSTDGCTEIKRYGEEIPIRAQGTSGLKYAIVGEEVWVVGYTGTDKIVFIPEFYAEKPIVGIENDVFSYNDEIVAVIIDSEYVQTVTNGEFAGCYGLEYIYIKSSVYDIIGITGWDGNVIPEIRYGGVEGTLSYDDCEVGLIIYGVGSHIHEYDNDCDAECNVCKALRDVGNHVYDDDYDTNCNRCGDVRKIEGIIANGYCGKNEDGSDLRWRLSKDGVLTIYGNGEMADYYTVLNSSGYKETVAPWGVYEKYVITIIVNDGVLSIGDYAFYNCHGIESITIGKDVVDIGTLAFRECSMVKNFNVSNDNPAYKSISGNLYTKDGKTLLNYALKRSGGYFTVPDSVTFIAAYAFEGCRTLVHVTLGKNVETVGFGAFQFATIESVTIPESVKCIYPYAFAFGGYSLDAFFEVTSGWVTSSSKNPTNGTEVPTERFVKPDNVGGLIRHTDNDKYWLRVEAGPIAEGACGVSVNWKLLEDGTLVIYGNGAMEDCFEVKSQPYQKYLAQITKVVVEEGVIFIGRNAFYGFTNITSVELPDTLVSIGGYAFYNTYGLTEITIPAGVVSIGSYAFYSSGITSANFVKPDGWYVGSANIPMSLHDASTAAIYLAYGYYSVNWMRDASGDGANDEIAGGYFHWSLSSKGVLTISGKGAMPNYGVEDVPWAAYKTQIVKVVIGEGITSVGRCAFYGCSALTEVSLPSTLTKIGEYGFYGCKKLVELTIPASVTEIDAYAFRRCDIVTLDFEIGYGWMAGETAFSATEIDKMGTGYLTLGYYKEIWTRDVNAQPEVIDPNFAYGGMCNTEISWTLTYVDDTKTKMKLTVRGKGAMPEYGTGAAPWYQYLNDIVEVEVCEGITSIGRCAFYGLKFVKSATIANTVTAIGDYAFNGCFSLKSIEIPDSVSSIGKDAFAKTGLAVIPTV